MDLKRLFQVLVVGSQMVGCSTARTSKLVTSDGSGDGSGDTADAAEVDRTEPADTIDALASDVTEQEAAENDAQVMTDSEIMTDAQAMTDAPITTDGTALDARARPCFCDTMPSCCAAHPDGTKGPVAGVECCWATSC